MTAPFDYEREQPDPNTYVRIRSWSLLAIAAWSFVIGALGVLVLEGLF